MVLCKKHKFGQKSSEVVFAVDSPIYHLVTRHICDPNRVTKRLSAMLYGLAAPR